MRHRKKGKKLGRKTGQRQALLKSLAVNLILNNKIKTTQDKARLARPFVEKVITLAKEKSLNSKHRIHDLITNDAAEKKLAKELAVKFKDRKCGYTRIVKLGERKGDNALLVQIEFV
jgi:large subunit ribosomal protein L17